MFGKTAWQDGILAQLGGVKKPDNWKEMEAKWKEGETKRAANEEETDKLIEEGLELAEKLGMKDKILGFKR